MKKQPYHSQFYLVFLPLRRTLQLSKPLTLPAFRREWKKVTLKQSGGIGTQGPAGKDGYTPIKGKDYFDGKDGANGTGSGGGSLTPGNNYKRRFYQGINKSQ